MTTYLIWNTATNEVTTQAPTREKIIKSHKDPLFKRGPEQLIYAFDDNTVTIYNWRSFSQLTLFEGVARFNAGL